MRISLNGVIDSFIGHWVAQIVAMHGLECRAGALYPKLWPVLFTTNLLKMCTPKEFLGKYRDLFHEKLFHYNVGYIVSLRFLEIQCIRHNKIM